MTALKLLLCVLAVEAGVAVLRKLGITPRPLPPPPAPLRLTVRTIDRPTDRPIGRAQPPLPPPGVDLAPVAVQPLGAQCRVCANPIERELLVCSACEAPHHEDCWQYNGGCSTYGCRSGVARPAP